MAPHLLILKEFHGLITTDEANREQEARYDMESESRNWMTVPEAAMYFCVPRSRMYDLIQRGEVPAVRLGPRSIRVSRTEAEQFLRENRSAGPSR
jgi:excisionase family DNA binding protein